MLRTACSSPACRANLSWRQAKKDTAVRWPDYRFRARKTVVLANDPGSFISSSQERERNKNMAWGRGNEAWKDGRRNISLSFQVSEKKCCLGPSVWLNPAQAPSGSLQQRASPRTRARQCRRTRGSSRSCSPRAGAISASQPAPSPHRCLQ